LVRARQCAQAVLAGQGQSQCEHEFQSGGPGALERWAAGWRADRDKRGALSEAEGADRRR